MQKLLHSLALLQSDPDEMEWENSNLTYFVAALPNRDETRPAKEGDRSGAFTDALSSGGEKMKKSQRRWKNEEPFTLHPDVPLACNNHARPQSR